MVSSAVKSHFGVNIIKFYGRPSNKRAAAKYRLRKHSFMRCFTRPVTPYYAGYNIVATIILIHHQSASAREEDRRQRKAQEEMAVNAVKFQWKRRANCFPTISSRGSRVSWSPNEKSAISSNRLWVPDLFLRPARSQRTRLCVEKEKRSKAKNWYRPWFDGGASNHDTVKYIAALFIESNASENNHRRASDGRGNGRGWKSPDHPFHSSVAESNARPRPMDDIQNWFNARFRAYRKPRLIT